ncbi:chromate efflux transporter [Cereibacter johrii]|uniref:chromate efflux transporter n=1 Tax=Cereibacter johrii TaxID=445629 RepID=UPI003CF53460
MHSDKGGRAAEVFVAFLRLGLTSFGGPVAHLGYFRAELVERRRWMDDRAYADLVALCQFLPGPASSQVGFAMGLHRAGPGGALAAWAGFTLPSALLMAGFGLAASQIAHPAALGALAGLKVVAVAIVAQAVWGMAASLCPDRERASLAAAAAALAVLVPGASGQIGAILLGALAGLWIARDAAPAATEVAPGGPPLLSRRAGIACLAACAALLALLPLLAGLSPILALADGMARAGALVFGGGHVVLPLLEAETVRPGLVTPDAFLAGYGAAQAMPGPLFTFAAHLGAVAAGPVGAAVALVAIFAPGLLLLCGALPFWDRLRRMPRAQRAMRGANAAVVGLLGAALWDPVFTAGVTGPLPFAMALAGFVLLTLWRTPPLWIVLAGAGLGAAFL